MKAARTSRIGRVFAFVGLLFSFIGSVLGAPADTSKVVIRLAGPLGFRQAGFYAAQAKGFFVAEALDVQLLAGREGLNVVGVMMQGEANYGVSDARVLVYRLNGSPIVLLAGISQQSTAALVVRADGGIAKPADLRGKRIAVMPPPASFEVQGLLRTVGVTPANSIFPGMLNHDQPVLDGLADAQETRTLTPLTEFTTAHVAARVFQQSDFGTDLFYGDSLLTTENELSENRARALAVRRAVLKGWEYALANRAEVVGMLLAEAPEDGRSGLAEQFMAEAEILAPNVKPGLLAIGYLNAERWQRAAAMCVELGVAASTKRLEGFLYDEYRPLVRNWAPWLAGGLAAAALVAVLVGLINVQLRRKVEERTRALKEAENRWELAIHGINDGIWDLDRASNRLFLSERCLEMLGFAPGEIQPSRSEWLARVHPDDEPQRHAAMEAHLAGQTPMYSAEFRMQCKDGRYKWLHARGRAIRDSQGRPVRSVGSHTDIHARKAAEQELRTSEERYRAFFEHSPLAIFESDYRHLELWLQGLRDSGVKDLERYFDQNPGELVSMERAFRITAVNQEAVNLLQAPSKKHVMEHLPETFSSDALHARRAVFFAVWEGRHEASGQVTLKTFRGGSVRAVFRWWVPVVQGKANMACTQIVLVDVTGMKRAEAALAAERERLRVTLGSMDEGVITADVNGVVQFMNEAAGTLTGWVIEAAIGRNVSEVCALRHERTRAPVAVPYAEAFNAARSMDLPHETVVAHRQGGHRLVEGRCAPMHDLSGSVIGVVFVFRDVTERSRLESELLRSSKLESVGVLAGGIAHDFNNILTIVMGNLALALLDEKVLILAGKSLREAERGALRARDLTQQLLTFAKGGDPVRMAVSLSGIVQEAAEFALHGSKVRCEFSLAPDAWPADADPGQIGQVVQNLVINAVQAMPEGGTIRIGVRNDVVDAGARPPLAGGNAVKISIADTGSGIRPEHLARIFDPYFTTKQKGSGLGLASTYSVIKKHQGHIEVLSELGQGTTFNIWLPAALVPAAGGDGTNSPFRPLEGRVLFMDDEEPIRVMAGSLLEQLGMQPQLVADGAAAVREFMAAKAAGKPYDVVVMDLTVPGGMGGKEAMVALLKLDPAVRVIVSSGYSSDPIMSEFRSHGFMGCVAKPYTVKDFSKVLRQVLDGGAARTGAK